jgi:hypothetical protein
MHLFFDCGVVAAAGFVAGRLGRPRSVLAGSILAVSFCLWDFEGALALNVPFLVRLIWNSFHDAGYLDALVGSLEVHVLLFGCLTAGVMLSRPREKMISIR